MPKIAKSKIDRLNTSSRADVNRLGYIGRTPTKKSRDADS